jgi:hypothetical protein
MPACSTFIKLLVTALAVSRASCFSVPDSFHLIQTASTSFSHQLQVQVPQHHFDLLGAYKEALLQYPLPTKMMTGATLAVAGDAIAQSQSEDESYDTRRAASFAVFDSSYRALQHVAFPVIVAHCHGQFLGAVPLLHDKLDQSWLAAMEQTLASQLGIVPFMYYPAFFALTAVVQGLSMSGAVARAQEKFLPLMKRNLVFWIPVQFVQFGFLPEDLQIPFLSVCGLAWTFILSAAAGSTKTFSPPSTQENEQLLQEDESNQQLPVGRGANATASV